jgi:hypothetical protein
VVYRRPLEWVIDMLEYIPVSPPTYDELLKRFGPKDDPEVEARRQRILQALLQSSPQARQQLIDQGQLISSRAHLRRVLERRQLRPSPAEAARIEACTELATLERWLDGAITAASVAEVLADPQA